MKRNLLLDYSRLILAVFVIHTNFASEIPLLGFAFNTLARVAVPIFFITSGYFLENKLSDKQTFNKYIRHLVIIYIVWTVLYIPYMNYESSQVNLGVFRCFIILLTGYFHLWYLAALISSALILRLFLKVPLKIIVFTAFIFYLIGLILNRFYLFGIQIPTSTLTTNFLFIGLFYVSLGSYIKRYNIISKLSSFRRLYLMLFVGFVILLLEGYILFLYDGVPSSFYIALPILAPIIFVILIKKGRVEKVSTDAASLSASVYFVHPMVIYLLRDISSPYVGTVLFIVVLFFSFLMGESIYRLNKTVNCLL